MERMFIRKMYGGPEVHGNNISFIFYLKNEVV